MKHWLDDSIFYEIYPQSFFDSNNDGIGDIPGITAKLDYIKDLGCNALWLNPCFLSPFGGCRLRRGRLLPGGAPLRHQRPTWKRCLPPPMTGTCMFAGPGAGAYLGGARLVQGELQGRAQPLQRAVHLVPQCVGRCLPVYEGIAGSLRGISERDGCVAVNFFSMQPALNYGFAQVTAPWQSAVDSPEALATRQAMKDVMAFWLDKGCDGFRVDMAGSLVKNDPGNEETIRLWQDMRAYLDESYPDAVLISEWGEPDKSLRAGSTWTSCCISAPLHFMDLFRCDHPFFSREGKGSALRLCQDLPQEL